MFATKEKKRLAIGGACLVLLVLILVLVLVFKRGTTASNDKSHQWSPLFGTTNTEDIAFPIENTKEFSLKCPPDQIVHHLWANAYTTVYSIGIQCGERKSTKDPPNQGQVVWSSEPSEYYHDIEPVMVEQEYIISASKAAKIVTSDKAGILQLGLSGKRGEWPDSVVSASFLNTHCIDEITEIRGTQGSSPMASQYGSVKNFQIRYKLKSGYEPSNLNGECPENQEMVQSKCKCVAGREGQQCVTEKCENGLVSNGKCECNVSYCGTMCEFYQCSNNMYEVNACINGHCKEDDENPGCSICECDAGWHGRNCEMPNDSLQGTCRATIILPSYGHGPDETYSVINEKCKKGIQPSGGDPDWRSIVCPGKGQVNGYAVYDCTFTPNK